MVSNVLLSIRLRFAAAILDGEKRFELRRARPHIDPGSRVWMYATKPTGAIVGVFESGEVLSGTPEWLWEQVGRQTALTREEFGDYFRGCVVGHAISVRKPQSVTPTLVPEGSTIPQSYRFLHEGEPAACLWADRAAI